STKLGIHALVQFRHTAGFAGLKSILTHRVEPTTRGQLCLTEGGKLFWRGCELEFGGDDLLHAVRFPERDGSVSHPNACDTDPLYKAIPTVQVSSGSVTMRL